MDRSRGVEIRNSQLWPRQLPVWFFMINTDQSEKKILWNDFDNFLENYLASLRYKFLDLGKNQVGENVVTHPICTRESPCQVGAGGYALPKASVLVGLNITVIVTGQLIKIEPSNYCISQHYLTASGRGVGFEKCFPCRIQNELHKNLLLKLAVVR